ncbi:hypothetical protein MMC30_003952 [Trapelia coarctata]|nr:hypothetical protein [Trapelia coarctata]
MAAAAAAGKLVMASGASSSGSSTSDTPTQIVSIATAAQQIITIGREIAREAQLAAISADNEFNIRKNFLDNALNAIKTAMLGQYCIIIATDQERDGEEPGWLQGKILPMELIEVEFAPGEFANFQVYVFEKGKYLRVGKWERDYWTYWPEGTKMWRDINIHCEFEAQPKVDVAHVEKQIADQKKAAEDAKAAADKATAEARAVEEAGNAEHAREVEKAGENDAGEEGEGNMEEDVA